MFHRREHRLLHAPAAAARARSTLLDHFAVLKAILFALVALGD
jgi:hypothetical protein